jgi:F-type H+-transporting ATPase subunit b
LAGPAIASGGDDGHGGDSKQMMWQAVNLVIILGVLFYAARKPVTAFFASRREQIQAGLDESAGLLRDAETRNSELQRRLADLDSELEDIREITRRRAEEESERVLAEARKSAERIQADAKAAVAQELRRAKRELRDEAAQLALDMAADLLKERIAETDRERLMDEFITRVEPGNER